MFFNGDTSARKRVDLGGRSSKQRNLEKVLEQNRLERKRRQEFRQRTSAATTIQKYFRGRKDFEMAREKVRKQFHKTFGDRCQNADSCFSSLLAITMVISLFLWRHADYFFNM